MIEAEDAFAFQLTAVGLCDFMRQYRYAPPRKLRADFAWPASRLLVEVQGGIYTRQAHGSITGVLADIERLNAATLADWRMLRVTPDMVRSGEALGLVERVLRMT